MGIWKKYGNAFQAKTYTANIPKNTKNPPMATQKGKIGDFGNIGNRHESNKNINQEGMPDPGAAWREWLDNCPRYPGGCFSCREAVLDLTYFCQEANRAVYGADMIEPVKEDAQ